MEQNWPKIYHWHLKIGTRLHDACVICPTTFGSYCALFLQACYDYESCLLLQWPSLAALWIFPSHNFLSALWVGCLRPSGRTVASCVLSTTHCWRLACDATHQELLKAEGSVHRGQTAKAKHWHWCHTFIKIRSKDKNTWQQLLHSAL